MNEVLEQLQEDFEHFKQQAEQLLKFNDLIAREIDDTHKAMQEFIITFHKEILPGGSEHKISRWEKLRTMASDGPDGKSFAQYISGQMSHGTNMLRRITVGVTSPVFRKSVVSRFSSVDRKSVSSAVHNGGAKEVDKALEN